MLDMNFHCIKKRLNNMTIDFWSPIKLSIEIALVSSIVVIILGIFLGKKMSNSKFRGKSILETMFLLPLVLPPSVGGFLLIVIFGRNSPVGRGIEWLFELLIMFTWWAAVIAAIVDSFAVMCKAAKTGFQGIDKDNEDDARVDGAG